MTRSTICLTMIVRDEAHVVAETIGSLADKFDTYSIVDTGSSDDTVGVIHSEMAAIGVTGEVHKRPWRNFGHNRTEALELAQGRADYMWMFDADDLFVGDADLGSLTADSYLLRIGADYRYWRKLLFRSGPRWRFEGVVHEYPVCLDPASEERLEGSYHVESRRLGARSSDPEKYMRDAELLAAELERNPDDSRSAYYLAQSLADAGEQEAALAAFEQRLAMEGFDEEAFQAALRAGAIRESLGLPWEGAQAAYLRAHELRPHRAEPLTDLARHHRLAGEPNLAYLYAARAAALPFPEDEGLFVAADVYGWRALDELAVAAGQTGRSRESYDACERLLAGSQAPEHERSRIEGNRDLVVPELLEETRRYPQEIVRRLAGRGALADPEVTLTITSCRRPRLFERTVNSFLNCCTDIERVGRFLCVDNGSTPADLERIRELYPFFEIVEVDPAEHRHAGALNRILELVDSPYWLQMEDDWEFFRSGPYVNEALAVLDAEPQLAQVAFNRNYAETLADRDVAGSEVRRTPNGLRYHLHEWVPLHGPGWTAHIQSLAPGQTTNAHWPHFTLRPSLIRRSALDRAGSFDETLGDFELEFARRYEAAGLRTGFLDRICSLHTGRLTTQGRGEGAPSAYELLDPSESLPVPTHRAEFAPEVREGTATAAPVVAINLDRRADRWEALQERLRDAAGAEFAAAVRRFSAVDGQSLELDDEIRHTFEGNDFGWRRSVIAVALSHRAIWREVAESGRTTLILEDDMHPEPSFDRRLTEVIEEIGGREREPDIVLLGYIGPRRWGGPGGRPTDAEAGGVELWPMRWERFWGGTWAYLLTPSGAARLLELAERDGIRKGIDVDVANHAAELDTYECVPALATAPLAEGEADSDVQYDGFVLPGAESLDSSPPPLASLLDVRLGSLALDVEPDWPLVRAVLIEPAANGSLRLKATTAEPGGEGSRDFVVTLGENFEVASVEAEDGRKLGAPPRWR
jgi:GR25 family glycosyltransferase involved in LPS biosynthesis/GT2 family glycosyltransferase